MVNQGSLLHSQDQYRYTVFVSKSSALVAMALVAMALGLKISPLLVQMEVG